MSGMPAEPGRARRAGAKGRRGQAVIGLVHVARALGPAMAHSPRALSAAGPSLAAVLAARVRHTPDDVVWIDSDGTLTAAELWASVEARRAALAGRTVLVHVSDQREGVALALAALAAPARAVVVPVRAGSAALESAVTCSPGALVVSDTAPLHPAGPVVRESRGSGSVSFSTSGTTGTARTVRQSSGARAVEQMLGLLGAFPAMRHPVVASAAAVDHGHGFGLFAAALVLGGCFVALPHDADGMVEVLAGLDRAVDVLSGVPRQLADLAELPPERLSEVQVRRVLSGSDRLTPAVAEAVEGALGAEVYNAYGSTETGTVCVATPRDRRLAPATVGRPVAGVRIEAVDDSGRPLPAGRRGRLRVRSALLAGPAFTGDRGWVDRSGLVFVTGRADGIRVTGGETVDPDALRERLLAEPGVSAVVVRETPDPRFGTRLVAELTVEVGTSIDVAALRARLRHDLGPALTPREIVIMPPSGR